MNFLAVFFIKNFKFTLVLTLFVMIFGISGTLSLKSESFPSVNIGAVVITTVYGGATAEDIETKITKPIESEIQKVSGLKQVKSTSQAGLSTIVTEVDIDRYNVEKVVAELQRAVDRASGLPTDLKEKPLFSEIKSDEFPVIEVAVVGSNKDRFRDEAADLLQEELKDNKKVSSIMMSGFTKRQFNIFLDRSKLIGQHVSIDEVLGALQARNITIPGGEIKGETSQQLVRIEGKAISQKEIEEIVVRSNFNGQRVLLKDVSRVEDSAEEPRVLASANGEEATFLVITKKGGADIIELAAEVRAVLAEYQKKYEGKLKFEVFSDEGIRVGDRLEVLVSNGWQGIVLVLFFLLLFLPGKLGFVASLSLPIALAATLGAVASLGYSLNTITIIGLIISIGMLVDNAVVMSENYTRLRDEGLSDDEALIKTVRDLWAPLTATSLATIAAFLPMLVTTGVVGQFIKAIPIVVSLSLLISLAENFFLLPIRLKFVNYKPKLNKEERKLDYFDRKLVPGFEKIVVWAVDHKWKSAGIFSGMMVATFVLLTFGNKINLFPTDQTEIYIMRIEANKGTRLEAMRKVISEVEKKVSTLMEGKALHVVSTAGESSTDISDPKGEAGSNTGMIRIYVNRETQDKVPTKKVLDSLRSIEHPAVTRLTVEALANGPPVGDPVTVTFRANNAQQLNAVAKHMKNFVAQLTGVFDAKIDDVYGDDEVTVKADYAKLSQLGLTLQDVGLSIRAAIAGVSTGDVNINNRDVDYFVRFESQNKSSISELSELKISDQKGNLIPLKNVSELETKSGSPQIKRYDFRRAKTVTANLDETLTTSIVANQAIAEEFDRIKDQYKDVSIVFGGEAEKTNESIGSLFAALILSVIGTFALLVLIFRSFISPLIILSTIPLGLIGVAFGFFIQQKDISFMAIIGVIGLGGIIVNSGIILISFIEQMREETKLSLKEILVKASALRLRAVLVTSLTTIAGIVPTALGIGGVDYFILPMVLALAWGLTTGTIFTLLWIAPAYAITESLTQKFISWRKS